MNKPDDYFGPEAFKVPSGYIDVTSLYSTKGRHGIAGPDHPYYETRARVRAAIVAAGNALGEETYDAYTDAVMEAL